MALTDRTYLVAGSLAHRLNEALPELATVLEADLDPIRKGVHVHVQVNKVVHYSFIEDKVITSHVDRSVALGDDRWNSPRKSLTVTDYMSDTTWAQFACDYITSEVNYLIALGGIHANDYPIAPTPTINDLVKSQAESEQGFSLA